MLSAIKDVALLQEMADRSFEEIALNPAYSYEVFIEHFDYEVAEAFEAKSMPRSNHYYTDFSYRLALVISPRYAVKRLSTLILQRILLGTKVRSLVFRTWGNIPFNIRNMIRPLLRVIGR